MLQLQDRRRRRPDRRLHADNLRRRRRHQCHISRHCRYQHLPPSDTNASHRQQRSRRHRSLWNQLHCLLLQHRHRRKSQGPSHRRRPLHQPNTFTSTSRKSTLYMSSTSSGPSCSKLTTSLVNDSLKFTSSDMQICWNFLLKNVSSFCSAKNIRILYIESAKTVNEMTLNELVKLTTLWTTGSRMSSQQSTKPSSKLLDYQETTKSTTSTYQPTLSTTETTNIGHPSKYQPPSSMM